MQALLDTPVEYLKGVGPQRAEALRNELGIYTYADLVTLYPFRYVDRSKFHNVNGILPDMPYVQLRGKIKRIETVGEKRAKRLVAYFSDGSGVIELVWFQGIKWIVDKLKPDIEYVVFGKPSQFNGKFNITHPELEPVSEENTSKALAWQAIYPSTEKLKNKGLDSKGISRTMRALISALHQQVPETLSAAILTQLHLMHRGDALRQIHFPTNQEYLKKAELRLKFEELFFIQLKLLQSKAIRVNTNSGQVFGVIGDFFNTFFNTHLPFPLTNAQKRVIKEIRQDMMHGKQMNRLLQGDVGSGKTMVSLMVMLIALDNNCQACLMAPTEILANQHYLTIKNFLKDMPVEVSLLTGSTKTAQRKHIHEGLVNGNTHILIGTHALLEDSVQFKNLGLAVIDEQHRFGVAQRAKLWAKNTIPPHVLVMTATPIPRTLAMTLYGDLDVSVIDELPAGRKPIKTLHAYDAQRLKVFGFMKEQIKAGRQVYVVYPLIKESEKMDYKDLMDGYESIVRSFPGPYYKVSIVHGQMKPADKDFEMERFVKGETQIMVATTVIEVGVNVPNASVMVIESAERFGLSQLHQLRGRVGRGAEQSYCVLMTSYKLSSDSKVRIETMVRTTDGFEIADVDLRLRGPGDIEGTQQSGVLDLKLADLSRDAQLLQMARNLAQEILEKDPQLQSPANSPLRNYLIQMQRNKTNWSKIS